jgi:hypothetical protein
MFERTTPTIPRRTLRLATGTALAAATILAEVSSA